MTNPVQEINDSLNNLPKRDILPGETEGVDMEEVATYIQGLLDAKDQESNDMRRVLRILKDQMQEMVLLIERVDV